MRISGLLVLGGLAGGVVAPLVAQSQVGVKGGLSFGNITDKGLLPGRLDTRTGAAAGLYFGTKAGLLSVGAEALYAQRGLQSDEPLATAAVKVDHVDLPVYLKVTAPTPGIRPFGYAGPQVSFEIKCRRANGPACADDPARAKTNYAAVIGGGVKFGAGAGFGVEARYVYGLTDLKLGTVTNENNFKHRTFLLVLSYGR